jgi:taurine dioxygenase
LENKASNIILIIATNNCPIIGSGVYMGIKVKRVGQTFAAEISGIDLTKVLDKETFEIINQALLEHKVIFFRDQDISAQNHRDFSLNFGQAHTHPAYKTVDNFPELTILESTKEEPTKISVWHTDMTFSSTPPMGSILRAIDVPDIGGDTMWSDCEAAFKSLDKEMQLYLSTLEALHTFEHGFQESLSELGGRKRLASSLIKYPGINHPVIRTHPITKKKCLFINRLFTQRIIGLSETESSKLINILCDHMIKEEYTFRFKWEKNSIAMWDNRCTKHVPINDYYPNYRQMQRITIIGDRPY